MILHILNRPPSHSRVYRQALDAMTEQDCLLLIEDAVSGALTSQIEYFQSIAGRLYVLREDLVSRALDSHCAEAVRTVDMEGFVQLTEEADKTVSWY